MKISSLAAVAFMAVLASASVLSAGTLTLDIQVDKAEYGRDEPVAWEIHATSDTPADAGDFGIATIGVDLTESRPESIPPADLIGPDFGFANGYSFPALGTPVGNSLLAIGNTQFMNGGNAVGGGPMLLASGTYVPTHLGEHMLEVTVDPGSATYWSEAAPGISQANYLVTPGSAGFTVVPEPGSLVLLLGAVVGGALLWWRRRK